jgi:uncharacterized protein (DUF1778 family)
VSTNIQKKPTSRPRVAARINLRVDARVKTMLVRAAKMHQVKLTEFMIKASQAAAENALSERTRFVLPPEKWREFNAALDAPAREIPALRKLLNESSVGKAA